MFTVCLNDLTIAELRGLARTDHVCGQRFRGKRCRSQKAASLDVHDLDVHDPRFQPFATCTWLIFSPIQVNYFPISLINADME